MNAYIERVLKEVREKNGNEKEFLQTVEEVLSSLAPVVERHPEYEAQALLERMVEPERVIEFRVVWTDDAGKAQVNRGYRVQDYADKFGAEFFAGQKPWGRKVDVVMPCATQNEVTLDDAKKIVEAGVKYYIEVSNMPTTNDALQYLMGQKHMIVAPSKAVNAGGVSVSALEMSQNSMRYAWEAEEVDAKLKTIMKNIHDASAKAAEEYGFGYNLVAGANIAGFLKVAEAMLAQGLV